MSELEKELSKNCTQEQWKALKKSCEDFCIPMDEDALEYGSVFIAHKVAFLEGWDAAMEARSVSTA